MKKGFRIVFFALLLLQSHITMAQYANSCLFREGKEWNYECTYYGRDAQGQLYKTQSSYTEWIEGDTVILDKTYFRMRSSKIAFPVTSSSLWREEDKRIYAYNEDTKSEVLMYDFNLKAGDRIDMLGINDVEVSKVDTITVNGMERRRIFIGPSVWVEGIGSPYLLSEPLGHLLSDGNVSYLVSCKEDGQSVFSASDFDAGGNTNAIKQAEQHLPSGIVFDLQGRRLQGKPVKGIYIRDGKKIAAE